MILGSYLTIHQTALVCLIFPVMFWFTFILMPESPYYCLMKEDSEGAKAALQVGLYTQILPGMTLTT